ncbi:hypothetical protein [Maridesulfovibrio sp.]|uniref:hypothetical protein n=1 Tax=unclassified Maridesulfovibrio TaxID=2794999 RepID=UPI003AFFA275
MTEQELQEMSEELAVLKMSVDTLSKRFKIALLKAKAEGLAFESESKGQPEDMEPQTMHSEAKHLKTQVQGYVGAFMELGLAKPKALEAAMNYCGIACAFDSYDL